MGLFDETHEYSYSQLTSFDECKYNFYLQRVEGIDEPASNAFAERGSLIHDLLDMWSKKILTKEEMLEEYERRYSSDVETAWPRMMASKGYAQKAYDTGIQFLENFDEFEGYEVLSAEERFEIDLPLTNGSTRKFVGIIDMLLREKSTGYLIICDHKSKSMSSFKKEENKMYRQQYIYSLYVEKKYGKYPDVLMFHLFNESGVKPQRFFSVQELEETLEWATKQIEGIEGYSVIDWLACKDEPDFYCTELCNARKICPVGMLPLGYKKRQSEEYEGYKEE